MIKDSERKSLERENILLRTQVSDLVQNQLAQQDMASKERQALLDSFLSLLGSKRASTSTGLKPVSPLAGNSYFPGSLPNLRPPYPLMTPESQPSGDQKDLSLISDKSA